MLIGIDVDARVNRRGRARAEKSVRVDTAQIPPGGLENIEYCTLCAGRGVPLGAGPCCPDVGRCLSGVNIIIIILPFEWGWRALLWPVGLCFPCPWWRGRLCRRRCAAGGCARAVLVWGNCLPGYYMYSAASCKLILIIVTLNIHSPPSSVVVKQCLWEVFVWFFFLVVRACV